MSTKTSIKRIALVAVSALGFGLLSVVPAKAAAGDISGLTATSSTAAANFISFTASGTGATATARAGEVVSVTVAFSDAGQAGAISAVGTDGTTSVVTTTGAATNPTINADANNATADNDIAEAVNILVPSTLGSHTITVKHTLADSTVSSGTISLTVVGAPKSITVTPAGRVSLGTTAPAANSDQVKYVIQALDANGRATYLRGDEVIYLSSSIVSGDATSSFVVSEVTGDANQAALTDDKKSLDKTEFLSTVGATGYTIFAENGVNNASYDITATLQDGVTVVATPTTFRHILKSSTTGLTGTMSYRNATPATITSLTLSQGNTSGNNTVRFIDSDGRTISGATVSLAASTGLTLSSSSLTTGADGVTGTFTVAAGSTATSGTVTATVSTGPGSSITATLNVTVNSSVFKNNYDVDLEASTSTQTFKELTDVPATDVDTSAATATYNINPSADTVSMTVKVEDDLDVAISGAVLGLTIADNGASIADDTQLSLSATSVTTDSTGTATFTATLATPAAPESYTVVVKSGTDTVGTFTVTYAAASATTTSTDTSVITTEIGKPTSIVFTVTDQYGAAWAGKDIALTRSGINASASVTLTTNTSGQITYTYTDVAKSAGSSDTVSVTSPSSSVVVTYSATAPAVASFAWSHDIDGNGAYLANSSTAIADAIATANGATPNAGSRFANAKFLPIDSAFNYGDTATVSGATTAPQDEEVELRLTATNAAGTALGGVLVTITASAGAYIVDTTAKTSVSKYTNASGQVSFVGFGTLVGTSTWTVTSGSTSASISVDYRNDVEDARYVAFSSAPDSGTSGSVLQYVAKVTDRYGNAVSGVNVVFTESGQGRLEGSTTVATDSSGLSKIDFSTLSTESGAASVIATTSGAQFANEAGKVGTAAGTAATPYTDNATAGIATVTKSITISAGTAKTNDQVFAQAEAAEAEAKKATTTAGEAKTEAALATAAATTAGTKADAAKDEAALATAAATTAGTKADAAKAEAALATAAATKAGTDAVAAAKLAQDAATKAGTDASAAAKLAQDAATKAGTDAVAAADAAKAEAAKATAAAAANAVEIAKILAAVTALKADTSAADAYDSALEAIDASNAATDAAQLAMEAADAATVAAEEARDAADAATAAVEELATQVSTLLAGLKAQLTTLANTVAKIAKKVKA